jgi:hypothetical protein
MRCSVESRVAQSGQRVSRLRSARHVRGSQVHGARDAPELCHLARPSRVGSTSSPSWPESWRRADSREPVTAIRLSLQKCTGGELNPYALRRRNLNPLRLPVSPPVRVILCGNDGTILAESRASESSGASPLRPRRSICPRPVGPGSAGPHPPSLRDAVTFGAHGHGCAVGSQELAHAVAASNEAPALRQYEPLSSSSPSPKLW